MPTPTPLLALALVIVSAQVCCGVLPRPGSEGEERRLTVNHDYVTQLLKGMFPKDTVIAGHLAEPEGEDQEEGQQEDEPRERMVVPRRPAPNGFRPQEYEQEVEEEGQVRSLPSEQDVQAMYARQMHQQNGQQQTSRKEEEEEEVEEEQQGVGGARQIDMNNVQQVVRKMFGDRNVQMGQMKVVRV